MSMEMSDMFRLTAEKDSSDRYILDELDASICGIFFLTFLFCSHCFSAKHNLPLCNIPNLKLQLNKTSSRL